MGKWLCKAVQVQMKYSINEIFLINIAKCQIVYNLVLTICRDALVQLTELMLVLGLQLAKLSNIGVERTLSPLM